MITDSIARSSLFDIEEETHGIFIQKGRQVYRRYQQRLCRRAEQRPCLQRETDPIRGFRTTLLAPRVVALSIVVVKYTFHPLFPRMLQLVIVGVNTSSVGKQ